MENFYPFAVSLDDEHLDTVWQTSKDLVSFRHKIGDCVLKLRLSLLWHEIGRNSHEHYQHRNSHFKGIYILILENECLHYSLWHDRSKRHYYDRLPRVNPQKHTNRNVPNRDHHCILVHCALGKEDSVKNDPETLNVQVAERDFGPEPACKVEQCADAK